MLQRLYIRHFTLIEELDISFSSGFSVITGETGAGKSIILGALGLLLGQRADTKSIKAGCDRCVIEGHFDLSRYNMEGFFEEYDLDYDAKDCILRREITSAGKSRSFVNDTPVSLTILRELGSQLVDIHSQHQNLLLNKDDFQLNVVDIIAGKKLPIDSYRLSYQEFKTASKTLEEMRENIRKNRDNEDFLRYQYHELEEAQLREDELDELEQEYQMLSHAEEIKSALYEADTLLSGDGGIVEYLKKASQSIDSVRKVFADIEETASRLESSFIELKDIAGEVAQQSERIEFDPVRLEEVSTRLDRIYHLQQKFHVSTVGELIAVRDDFGQQLNSIDHGDEELMRQEELVEKLRKDCEGIAREMTAVRREAAKTVEDEMSKRLVPLGIPKVKFEVSLQEKPLSADGHDKVAFLFTANTNMPLQPVAQVASGGEIARVMLSLKAMISGAVKLPTIIFDEIDTGVSGKVAEMMARIMEEMGANDRQVISITHLPQIASRGAFHYKVFKDEGPQGTVSHMCRLNDEQRVEEIAQMLSGSSVSEAAKKNAKELLGMQ